MQLRWRLSEGPSPISGIAEFIRPTPHPATINPAFDKLLKLGGGSLCGTEWGLKHHELESLRVLQDPLLGVRLELVVSLLATYHLLYG